MTDPRSYGDTFADVYDDWYADLSPTAPFVASVLRLLGDAPPTANSGRVLELGVGTGRLALPLATAGVAVTGLDASAAMLQQLAAKTVATKDPAPADAPAPAAVDEPAPAGADAPAPADTRPSNTAAANPAAPARASTAAPVAPVQADMAALPFRPAAFDGVVIAYNTLFNLTADGRQQFCIADAARVVRPGGFVAVETFVAAAPPPDERTGVSPHADRANLFIASRQAADSPVVDGAHITFGDDGVVTRPWRIRPMQIHEIDIAANTAGLSLAHRWASWSADPFTTDSDRHVSIYRSTP